MAFFESVLKGVDDLSKGAMRGVENTLSSNKAINGIRGMGKFVLGAQDDGVRGFLAGMSKEGNGFKNSLKGAYTKELENGKRALNYKAVAGTYVGASLVGRVATGGGVYRDNTGHTNLAGVPFI